MNFGKKIRMLREQKGITQQELAEAIGVGRTTITQYEKGTIEPSLSVLKAIARYFKVPVDYLLFDDFPESNVGEILSPIKQVPLYSVPVSAGDGVFPDEIFVLRHIPVFSKDVDFAVQVKGDSMEPVAPENSILLVKKQDYAFNGDMVVCTYDGWVYVKWFIKDDDKIMLLSENPTYRPIVVEPDDRFIVHGIVKEIMIQTPKKIVK